MEAWADTSYAPEGLGLPGTSEACDRYCTRAIECAAEAEDVELDPDQLRAMKQTMTGTWVECAVRCEKRRASEGERELGRCNATKTCDDYFACAEKL